jgi:predicted TPR repeat methyltransferase
MVDVQSNPDSEGAASVILDPDPQVRSDIMARLEEALDLLAADDKDAAWDICDKLLDRTDIPVHAGSKIALVVERLGKKELADRLKASILENIRQVKDRLLDPERALMPAAEALSELGQDEEAEALCRQALEIAPSNLTAATGLVTYLTRRDRHDEAWDTAVGFLDRNQQNEFDVAIHFSMVFGYQNQLERAKQLLERATATCKTKPQRAKLEHFMASFGMTNKELDQHGMAVDLFDDFAESYDQQLQILQNNGPSIIFTALEELQLPKTQTWRVMDAGCGTGLCAGFLREYAKELHGVDLSVKMLEVSRNKGQYDFLARTDLSVPETFPEGKFDLIVCADVLVYFGPLRTVLSNFFKALQPGGLLVFTVETLVSEDTKTGFKLLNSARHAHSDEYLLETLKDTGFPNPKLMQHARLRNEMGRPVLGTVVAVQKPALVF